MVLSDEAQDGDDPAALNEPRTANRIDLDEALKTLSKGERLCVSLCYGGDWSHGEVAEALNIPVGTVKSHVKRGLDKLRARLVPQTEGARREAHG